MEERRHRLKGAVLIVSATIMFCVMASLVRYVRDIDATKTSLFRFVVGLALLGSAAMSGRIRLAFNNTKLLLLRGLLGGAGIYITFLVIVKIGMSRGMMLISTYPVFACLFAAIFLKEKMRPAAILAIAGSFVGIYLLSAGNNGSLAVFGSFRIYEILAVVCGVVAGLTLVIIRKLHQTDDSYAIFFAQCIVGFWLVVAPANIGSWQLNAKDVVILLFIGLTAAAGQLLMTQGYKYLPVRIGSVLGLLEAVLDYIVGLLLFTEAFSWLSLSGAALIIICSVAVLMLSEVRQIKAVEKIGMTD